MRIACFALFVSCSADRVELQSRDGLKFLHWAQLSTLNFNMPWSTSTQLGSSPRTPDSSRSRSPDRSRSRSRSPRLRLTQQLLHQFLQTNEVVRFERVQLRMLSGEAVVECRSDVEAGTISGMRSLNSLFYVRAWLRINSDGTTTRIDAQLSQLIPSGRTPAEFRSHFTEHSESTLKLGIWGSYTLIFKLPQCPTCWSPNPPLCKKCLGVGELGAGVGLLRPGDAFSSNGRSSSSGGGRHGGSLRRQP